MTTPIDFEPIAHPLLREIQRHMDPDHARAFVLETMRLVWNARGAADLAKLESELSQQMGATAAGPYLKNLDRALRRLDR
jgi:hypothetical protein